MINNTNPVIESVFKLPGTIRVRAYGAGPYIKSALLLRGNIFANYDNGQGITKSLHHHRGLRPMNNAVWPISLVQAHDITFIAGNVIDHEREITEQQQYSRYSIDEAISRLLSDVPDDAEITIDISEVDIPFFPNLEPFIGLTCGVVHTLYAIFIPIIAAFWYVYENEWRLITYMVVSLLSSYVLSYMAWAPFSYLRKVGNVFSEKKHIRYAISTLLVFPIIASAFLQLDILNGITKDSPHKWGFLLLSTWMATVPLVNFKIHYRNFKEGRHALHIFQGFLILCMLLTGYGIISGYLQSYIQVLCAHGLIAMIANYFAQSSLSMQFFGRAAGWIKDE